MVRFGSERLQKMMNRLGMDDSTPIESKMVSRAVESAQKRVEGNNFDARKRILEYDEVLRKQREIIYNERNEIIDSCLLYTSPSLRAAHESRMPSGA